MDVNALLRYTVERGASDLHLKVGNVPFVRIDGALVPGEFDVLTPADTETTAAALMSDHKKREFAETSEADLGYTLPGVGRFRVNLFRQRGVVGLAIRRVQRGADVRGAPTAEGHGRPGRLAPRSGARDRTNRDGQDHDDRVDDRPHQPASRAHIVTIEDPIEVMHDDELSIVQQREIGIDTDSYANALRHVIRQDPDVIFVGEIRDGDSVMSALQAAETGHLVISTLHTIDCMETINRIVDLFPPHQQREVRTSLAGSLRGIVSQRLVAKADGKGRVPAIEVLINTGRVFDRIVDPTTTDQIVDVIAEGDFYGMQTFDQSLVQLSKEGLVAEDEARRSATNPHDFDLMMRGVLDRLSVGEAEGLPF